MNRIVANRYRLDTPIGRGGFGVVWRAEDTLLGRVVAVKEILIPAALDDEEQARMRRKVLREARTAARLTHPGAVTVFDVLDDEGRPYIVMELIEAVSLAELVRDQGPLSLPRAAQIGLQLLDIVQAAHTQGIVHRDIKPGNVLVPDLPPVRLADFGIASIVGEPSLTTSGIVPGSPAYMSPEQASAQEVGPPTDLWSLGATLYFALEGEPPFDKGAPIPTMLALVNDEPRPPVRSGALEPALRALLTKDPSRRPSPAAAVAALQAALAEPERVETATTMEMPPARPVSLPDPTPPGSTPVPAAVAQPRSKVPPFPAAAQVRERTVLRLPPQSSPPDEHPQAPAPPPWDPGRRAGSGRRGILLVAALILVAGAGALAIALLIRAPVGGRPAGVAASSPSVRPSAGSSSPVPTDWVAYNDPATGFGISHPPSWSPVTSGIHTDFRDPVSGAYLRVDHVEPPGPSAVGAWQDQEKSFAPQHPGYQRLQLVPATYDGFPGAIWEFTYSGGSNLLHALDLGFITPGHGFALYFQTRDTDWQRLQPVFDSFKSSFRAPPG